MFCLALICKLSNCHEILRKLNNLGLSTKRWEWITYAKCGFSQPQTQSGGMGVVTLCCVKWVPGLWRQGGGTESLSQTLRKIWVFKVGYLFHGCFLILHLIHVSECLRMWACVWSFYWLPFLWSFHIECFHFELISSLGCLTFFWCL